MSTASKAWEIGEEAVAAVVHRLERERNEAQAALAEAERRMAGDFGDVLALADVNLRAIDRQLSRLENDAASLRTIADGLKGKQRGVNEIANRVEARAKVIRRSITTPDITAYRKAQDGRAQRKRQQAMAETRARLAEARLADEQAASGVHS